MEISSTRYSGWQVLSQDGFTVTADVTITDNLEQEGLREISK